MFSSPNKSPFSQTKTNLSTSGSRAIPKSAFSSLTVFFNWLKFLSSGSGLCAKFPSGSQLISITEHPNCFRSSGTITPPLELIPSTTTLNFLFIIFSQFTSLRFFTSSM